MKIKVKKLVDDAKEPVFALHGDAGADLTVTSVERKWFKVIYGFGIAIEIPTGNYGAIVPRSSIHKTFQLMANSYGVIDEGYRGELKMICYKLPFFSKLYKKGNRAAQLIIKPTMQLVYKLNKELNESERNGKGFGSSGK